MTKCEYFNRQPDVPQLLLQVGERLFSQLEARTVEQSNFRQIVLAMNTADAAMVDTTMAQQWLITVNSRFVPTR